MMGKRNIAVVGIPGNMAMIVADYVLSSDSLELVQWSLNLGEEKIVRVGSDRLHTHVSVITDRDRFFSKLEEEKPVIAVDFTAPNAVEANVNSYCKNGISFVMGTTGGDLKKIIERVKNSDVCAVVAPNMAKPIVLLQAMFEFTAKTFPGALDGFLLDVCESHQSGKKDTSGTAKAMVKYFNALGIPFGENDIRKERSALTQKLVLEVPEEFLGAHGWHTYTLSNDGVKLEFTHNVNGRKVYAEGTLDAVRFLHRKVQKGSKGEVFSMIDVLKG